MGDGAEGDKAAGLPKTSHLFFPFLSPPWDWQDFQLMFSNQESESEDSH